MEIAMDSNREHKRSTATGQAVARAFVQTVVHTVDLLEEAISVAERVGFTVRRQWLTEGVGGACRVGAQRILFVNLAASSAEQLAQVVEAIRSVELAEDIAISDSLGRMLARSKDPS